jgi:hypothetical protein
VELLQHLTKNLCATARFSAIAAPAGFPLVGDGEFGEYFFEELTEDLSRLSLGTSYRLSPNLQLKAEYNFTTGREVGGHRRDGENLFALQVAFKF